VILNREDESARRFLVAEVEVVIRQEWTNFDALDATLRRELA